MDFVVNTSPNDLIAASSSSTKRTYTWDTTKSNELALGLNVCRQLELDGWTVCLESPVLGIQRSYRIPVFAFKDSTAILVKPVADPKKVNVAGLKMLDIKISLQPALPSLNVIPVVYAFLDNYDDSRRTNTDYEIWLRG
jgi:hypothetical protein